MERIADVVVEFVPGDRLLAERIAGAVWEHLSIPPLMVLPGIDQDPDQFAEAMRKWRPVLMAPERDEVTIGRELMYDLADRLEPYSGIDLANGAGRAQVAAWIRGRADAASGSDRRTAASGGPMRGDGDGTSEGDGRG